MNKRIGKHISRLVSIFLVTALLAGQTVVLAAPSRGHFTDVPEGSWAYEYVEKAYADGAVSGVSGDAASGTGVFNKSKFLTYAEFVTIMTKAFYAESIPAAQSGEPWYAPYLKTGISKKILTVDTVDKAMAVAQENINRYDMAEIMVKILIDKNVPLPSLEQLSAVNARIPDWDEISKRQSQAYYVSCTYTMGLLAGVDSKGTFMGDAIVSRLVAAVVYCSMAEAVSQGTGSTNAGTSVTIKNAEDLKKIPGIEKRCNADAIFQLNDNWYYSTDSGEKDKYIEGIFSTLYPQYADIFGEEAMSYRPVIIYNSPDAPNPNTSAYEEYTIIKLSLDKTSYWSKMIFQLSHEMTHFAFGSSKPDSTIEKKRMFSQWNEEIICEAMSLYMLDYMSENWAQCPLSKTNRTYGSSIGEYLEDAYNEYKGISLLSGSSSLSGKEFKALSDAANKDRDRHGAETNYCYDLYVKYGDKAIGEVLNMYRYYNSEFSYIDFVAWANQTKHVNFVKELSRIQPEIVTG